ncbi:MAG TPA: zf-HC2 domain-containing protein [Pyrinomonadaceae bacterium]|nr:zf-HC2 domain-containing protein [Pyrinomonadaceae bacterium]
MICDEYQLLIEEYLDGELDQPTVFRLRKHLGECSECAGVLKELRAEADVYAGYKPRFERASDLWPGVLSRIAANDLVHTEAPSLGFVSRLGSIFSLPPVSAWATAGLVLLAIALTAIIMAYRQPNQVQPVVQVEPAAIPTLETDESVDKKELPEKPVEAVATNERRSKPKLTLATSPRRANTSRPVADLSQPKDPNQLVREAEQKYLAAIAMLSRTAERKRSQMDSATRARLEQALASVDRTIASTRKVARQHPGDPVAVQYMLSAYSRKVDVLREIVSY